MRPCIVNSIEASARRPLQSALLKAVKKNSGSMIPRDVRDRHDPKAIWHYLLAINQPSRYCMDILQLYKRHDPSLSLYRCHIALDVTQIYEGVTREQVIDVFARKFHLRYRRTTDELLDWDGSIYSIAVNERKSRPYRNSAFYTRRHSKLTGECDAIHFEIRLEKKRSVLRAGIEEPQDLFTLLPVKFVAQHLVTKDHDVVLETDIQRILKASPEFYGDTAHVDLETRIRGNCRRIGLWHVSVFARYYKKQFERLQHQDPIDYEDRLEWASKDVVCEDEVGKLMCLLPPPKFRPIKRVRLGVERIRL